MPNAAPTVSLDQHHWIRLARAVKHPKSEPTYKAILDLGAALRSAGRVRFPLSADRYHETLRVVARQRIDVAYAMATLSGYETLLQLDSLTIVEIDAVVHTVAPAIDVPEPIPVIGQGCMHAFGRRSFAESLMIRGPVEELGLSPQQLELLTAQMQAVAAESWANQFEWSVLSGDPRVRQLDTALRADYDDARRKFADEERRRLAIVHDNALDPVKAAYAFAYDLHLDALLERVLDYGLDPGLVLQALDAVGIVKSVPTVHVLAELLGHQYRNPMTQWNDTDWADMRTLCIAVPYCDAVAPDRKWAAAVNATGLAGHYDTRVLRNADEVLEFLRSLDAEPHGGI